MKQVFSTVALGLALTASAAPDRCRKQPDGTQLVDYNNPQGYIVCQNGKSVYVDCPDDLYYDDHDQMCDEKKMCKPPSNWRSRDYTYADGIYWRTWIQTSQYGPIQGKLLCDAYGGHMAEPVTDKEYEDMKREQNRAIVQYLNSTECLDPRNNCGPYNGGEDYGFWMGIESILSDQLPDDQHPFYVFCKNQLEERARAGDREAQAELAKTSLNPKLSGMLYSNYYYVSELRTGTVKNWCVHGPLFTQNSWWIPGYPTNQSQDPQENFQEAYMKKVIQLGNQGLKNVAHASEYYDGVNCMYVCPGYESEFGGGGN